jgi:hypothetical protein
MPMFMDPPDDEACRQCLEPFDATRPRRTVTIDEALSVICDDCIENLRTEGRRIEKVVRTRLP